MQLDVNIASQRLSPAFQGMALDILEKLLSEADNPNILGTYLTQELRELTGARTVILLQCLFHSLGKTEHRIICVNPERRRNFAESEKAGRLFSIVHDLMESKVWGQEDRIGTPEELFSELDCGLSITIPLRVGSSKVGELLLLDLPETQRILPIVEIVDLLSTVVALVFRNSLVYEDQEVALKEQTRELSESEERYRSLFDKAPLMYVITRNQRGEPVIEDCNELFLQTLDYKRDEVTGKPLANFYTSESADRLFKGGGYQRALEGRFIDEERQLLTKDGRVIHTILRAQPERDAIDNVVGTRAMFVNISERKQAEEALRASEEKYRLLAENASDVIFTLDLDFNYTYVSPAVTRMRGYSAEELMEQGIENTLTSSSMDLAATALAEELAIEEKGDQDLSRSRNLELEMYCKDGSTIWTEVVVSFLRDQDNNPIGILGVTRDVSERKQAEEALIENENKYRLLVETSQDLIFQCDTEGRFMYLNPAWESTLGYKLDEMLGHEFTEFKLETLVEKDTAKFAEILGGEPAEGYYTTYISKDNTPVYLRFNAKPLIDINGNTLGTQGTAYDVTEMVKAESALKESEEKYRDLYENAPIAYSSVSTLDGSILRCNRAMENLTGYDKDALLEMKIFDLLGPSAEAQSAGFELFEKFREGESLRDVELQMRPKSGDIKWVSLSFEFIRDQEGNIIESQSVAIDITDRKQDEEAIRRSKILLESSIESPKDMIILSLDREYRYLYFNKTHAESMGDVYGARPRTGDCIFDHMKGKDDIEKVKAHYDRAMAGEGHIAIEEYGEGQARYYYEIRYNPINDEKNEIIGVTSFAQDITERKQAEEALRASERKYRLLAENASDVIFTLDMDSNYTYVSPAVTRMRGYSTEEVMEQGIENTLTSSSMELVAKTLAEELAIEEKGDQDPSRSRKLELEMNCKDGSIIWTEVVISFLRGRDNNPIGILGVTRDISERKQAEEVLRESEDKFRLISEQSLMGIFISQDGRVKYANEALSKLSGYPTEEILSWERNESLKLIHPDYREFALEQGLKKQSNDQEGVVPSYEVKGIRKSGEERWVDIYSKTIMYQKKPANLVTFIDVTERKQAQEALIESEERYRNIVENIDEIIYVLDPTGSITYISPACEKILGYKPEEIIGRSPFDFIFKEDHAQAQEEFRQAINDETVPTEYRIVPKSGGLIWIRFLSKPLFDGDHVVAIQGVLTDITAFKTSQEEKRKLETQLQQAQKMEAIGTLAGGIAHDFNNILGAVMGYTDLAIRDVSEEDPIRYFLEQINRAGYRAKDLVKQILLFSRQQEHEKKPVKFGPLIKEAAKLLRASIPSTVEIHTDISTQSDLVQADPSQLHQILMNLCTNAAHAMRERGGILGIGLHEINMDSELRELYPDLEESSYLKLEVSDTGHGMPVEVMDRIFDPFFTTKTRGEGTGLGLSVVHGIVRDHGGIISVNSELGKGTSFEILIPRIEAVNESKITETFSPLPRGHERVFFIDDEQVLVDLGKEILESLGYTVTTRTSSIDALETFRLQPERFDIILTDLTMPGMTGIELAREIIKIRPDIPVIMCTGFSEQETVEIAAGAGIREILNKPVIVRDMTEAIRRVLD